MFHKKYKVLLVDDDEEDHLIIQDLLADLREKTILLEWVSSFQAAQKAMKEGEYDAYLVDFRLGERSGLDLIQSLQEKQASTPVIVLTGQGDHNVDVEAMEKGAADYLVKNQLTAHLLERSIRYAVNRQKNLEDLHEREEGLRSLFNATFEGIIVHEKNGTILDINQTATKILDHTPDRLIGTNLSAYFSKSAGEILVSEADLSSPKTFATVCTRVDGSSVHLEVYSKPYLYGGRSLILTACRDISERIQMEAQILQQDRLASIGLLASSLAHEIGTPLGVIRGRAELLAQQQPHSESVARCVEAITNQIDRLSKLIRSLLTLARGQSNEKLGSVEVDQVVHQVLDLVLHELNRKMIDCQVDVKQGVLVMAESGPFHQVLLNLLVNSIHAIEEEKKQGRKFGHRIHISMEEQGDQILLSVEDNGCGISSENQKQLFKPFFTTKDIGEGTGLGLATSLRIVSSWGGTIQVESTQGLGTKFRLVLLKGKE